MLLRPFIEFIVAGGRSRIQRKMNCSTMDFEFAGVPGYGSTAQLTAFHQANKVRESRWQAWCKDMLAIIVVCVKQGQYELGLANRFGDCHASTPVLLVHIMCWTVSPGSKVCVNAC